MDIFIRQIYPAVVLLSRLLSIKAEIMSVSHENMTHILNTLLDGYDNRVMPGHIGKCSFVDVFCLYFMSLLDS